MISKIFLALLSIPIMNLSHVALAKGRTFYIDSKTGSDSNTGSKTKPLKSFNKLSEEEFRPGDAVYLRGGQIFNGTLTIKGFGTKANPIFISSYGNGNAQIDAGNGTGILVQDSEYVTVKNISLQGNGRKTGNTRNGLSVSKSTHIMVDDISVEGFQKSGVLIDSSSHVRVTKVNAFDNGFAGIFVSGRLAKTDCRDIYIGDCRVENNPGDPTVLNNHSGNGILVANCTNVLIEYCTATNNGWDMARKGNGPVGIWAYEADSVTIQHCLSYRNKTSAGSADGGGFDFDGGVTNSVIQHCFSYENEGAGYGIFQYAGASMWNNNTFRYNISENDGVISTAKAGVFVWNGSRDSSQFKNCYFYNNTVYNDQVAAISYAPEYEHTGFYFSNNIFVSKDRLITGKDFGSIFRGNNWWSIADGFNINGVKSLAEWADKTGQEKLDGKLTGLNIDPKFAKPGQAKITSHRQLRSFLNYVLPKHSGLTTKGYDAKSEFH